MATAFKIDTAPTDTAVAAVTLATTSDPRADRTFEAADGKDPVDISDDEVIAWLGERGLVGPFTPEFLDQTRSSIGGLRFVDMLKELHRDHPERILKLVAVYRNEPGLEEMGDAIERMFSEEEAKPDDDGSDGTEDAAQDFVPLDLPADMSTAMEALAEEYRSAYFSTDEDAGGKWADAAWKVEAFAPVSDADIAAKLTIGLHYAYPEGRDGRLEIDVGGCECPTAAARILISGIDALAKRAERLRLPEAGLRETIVPTLSTTAMWDRRLAFYIHCRDADKADQREGALRQAYDRHDAEKAHIVAEFGDEKTAKADPVGKARLEASFRSVRAAEELSHRRLEQRRWRAADLLLATPAPSLAELLIKMEVAREEGHDDEGEKIMDVVTADVTRLNGGTAASTVDAERVSVEPASPAESASAFDRAHGVL